MREFFKPLRRKVGIATLVLASMVTALWMHSETTCDFIEFEVKESLYSETKPFMWLSANGMAIRISFEPVIYFGNPRKRILGKWRAVPVSSMQKLPKLKWRSHAFGCGFGEIKSSADDMAGTFWSIQYWSIVLLLTLLSGCLLLSKPRRAKPVDDSLR
jgi:hypothetical protein